VQRFGDGQRRAPWQAYQLAAQRRHARDHECGVGLFERGLAGEQVLHQDAASEQVTRGGRALGAQLARIHRHAAFVGADAGGVLRGTCSITGAGQCHQAHAAALVDEHVVQLRVEVGDAGLVGERQPVQQIANPADDFGGLGVGVAGDPFLQRHALRAIDGDEGPVVLHADLGHAREVRVVQAGGEARVAQPVFEARRVDGLHPRQRQHHLGAAARIEGEPSHRADALAQQLAQLEAAERTGGARRGGRQGVGGHRERDEVPRLKPAAA
jgi:hypothetical protein